LDKNVACNTNDYPVETFEMEHNDPSLDIPIRESVEDAFGRQRSFIITYEALDLGYLVEAKEEGQDGLGYEFSFSQTSPYNALGPLREKMYRSLAMRHITKRGSSYQMMHNILRGRITWSHDKGLVLVVDGIPLDLENLREFLETHEGWQVRLEIADPSDDISK
jgi:hypothetical protein